MLKDILKKEYISIDVEATNWEEAINAAGKILIKEGIATQEYIKETIQSVKELGPYIVIKKGIAMPHATTHKGVNKNGIVLVKLKEPVEFGNKENDPVNYIFMLATLDMEAHISALSSLSYLLADEEFFKILNNAKNKGEIIEYIDILKY